MSFGYITSPAGWTDTIVKCGGAELYKCVICRKLITFVNRNKLVKCVTESMII